jgi:hypothetical protein
MRRVLCLARYLLGVGIARCGQAIGWAALRVAQFGLRLSRCG